MQAAEIVQEARNSPSGLPSEQALHVLSYQEEGATEDGIGLHAHLRAHVLQALQNTLSLNDRPLIRFLMEQEIVCRQNDIETEDESIHYGGFLLFLLGQVEDVELLWRAKNANFDTACGFDGECLLGAGVASTLVYLSSIEQEWGQKARSYIEWAQQGGSLSDLESYRNWKYQYFGLQPPLKESSMKESPETP